MKQIIINHLNKKETNFEIAHLFDNLLLKLKNIKH